MDFKEKRSGLIRQGKMAGLVFVSLEIQTQAALVNNYLWQVVGYFKRVCDDVGGHGEANPNANWLQSRGLWFSYCLGILAVHLILLSVPFITVPVAWTATNVFHNFVHLFFLHTIKGTPWLSQDQGEYRRLTHWEQIDNGLQFTSTKKFLSIVPVVLFFLTNFYTKYNLVHFYINFISLIIILLPKLPQFHKVRVFGINKY